MIRRHCASWSASVVSVLMANSSLLLSQVPPNTAPLVGEAVAKR